MLFLTTLCASGCAASPDPVVTRDAICAAIAPHKFTGKAVAGMDHADLVWADTVNDYLKAHCP